VFLLDTVQTQAYKVFNRKEDIYQLNLAQTTIETVHHLDNFKRHWISLERPPITDSDVEADQNEYLNDERETPRHIPAED
jgi:hypothetical protein